jgi:hypothetical protein
MTSSKAAVLERGKRIPNWTVKDHAGQKHDLWDYRQKSHLVLLHDPEASKETIQRWLSAIEADKKQWAWLNVQVLILKSAPKELPSGVHVVDRYGIYFNTFPTNRWNFDDLEREFMYYEARHC